MHILIIFVSIAVLCDCRVVLYVAFVYWRNIVGDVLSGKSSPSGWRNGEFVVLDFTIFFHCVGYFYGNTVETSFTWNISSDS